MASSLAWIHNSHPMCICWHPVFYWTYSTLSSCHHNLSDLRYYCRYLAAFFMRIGGRWCYIVPRWITSQWWYLLIWSLLYNSQNVFRYAITMALSMTWWSKLKYCFQLKREELRFKGLWCPFNQIQAVKQIPTVNTLSSKPQPLPSQ